MMKFANIHKALPFIFALGLWSSCAPSNTKEVKVNLGIPVKEPTLLESIAELANIVAGPKCKQNNLFLLMVNNQSNTIFLKKQIKLGIQSDLKPQQRMQ